MGSWTVFSHAFMANRGQDLSQHRPGAKLLSIAFINLCRMRMEPSADSVRIAAAPPA